MLLRFSFVSAGSALAFLLSACAPTQTRQSEVNYAPGTGPIDKLVMPAPFATPSARNTSKAIGWPKDKMPTPAPGFEVSLFADNLDNPRQAYVLPIRDDIMPPLVYLVRRGVKAAESVLKDLC